MNISNFSTILVSFVLMLLIASCESVIDTEVSSEIPSSSIFSSESGLQSVLNSAYANQTGNGCCTNRAHVYLSSMASGEAYSIRGGIEPLLDQLENFTWQSSHGYFDDIYSDLYASIRDVNIILENINNDEFSAQFQTEKAAEARFLRALDYVYLYNLFGPTPLHTKTEDVILPRASDEEMKTFIENELLAAAADLPVEQEAFGMATKGAALGILSKFYLNTKQWQKAAETARQVIDLNKYSLFPEYDQMFTLENEGNSEMIWSLVYHAIGNPHHIVALTFPTDYPLPQPNQVVFAAHKYLFDDFVNSFEEGDTRKNLIITEYTNISGEHIQLLGKDESLPIKYGFDPNASGPNQGNDIPVVRYADILLTRAEALNEMNGPNQESVDLINMVRNRANVSELNLADFPAKASLRDHIFQERRWEFFIEAKLREDQIRQGTFISNAQARGENAQSHHVLYPLPQSEMNANPELVQNEGY